MCCLSIFFFKSKQLSLQNPALLIQLCLVYRKHLTRCRYQRFIIFPHDKNHRSVAKLKQFILVVLYYAATVVVCACAATKYAAAPLMSIRNGCFALMGEPLTQMYIDLYIFLFQQSNFISHPSSHAHIHCLTLSICVPASQLVLSSIVLPFVDFT